MARGSHTAWGPLRRIHARTLGHAQTPRFPPALVAERCVVACAQDIEGLAKVSMVEVPVSWIGIAEEVKMMGSFDNWSRGVDLSPEDYTFSGEQTVRLALFSRLRKSMHMRRTFPPVEKTRTRVDPPPDTPSTNCALSRVCVGSVRCVRAQFSATVELLPGEYEVKFLVDGEWRLGQGWCVIPPYAGLQLFFGGACRTRFGMVASIQRTGADDSAIALRAGR